MEDSTGRLGWLVFLAQIRHITYYIYHTSAVKLWGSLIGALQAVVDLLVCQRLRSVTRYLDDGQMDTP